MKRIAWTTATLLLLAACNQRHGNGVRPDAGNSGDSGELLDMSADVDVVPDMSPVSPDMGADILDLGTPFDMATESENTPEACMDFADNDSDSRIDCEDSDCCDQVECDPGTACNPGVDAGTIDAATIDASFPSTESTVSACGDGVDNDDDSYADCDDTECCGVVACGTETRCGGVSDTCEAPHAIITSAGAYRLAGSIERFTDAFRTSCDGLGPDAMFVFRPTTNGSYVITTGGSHFDTLLAVYGGSCVAETLLACNDDVDPASDTTSTVNLDATAGTDYFVFIDAYDAGAVGTFYVSILWDS